MRVHYRIHKFQSAQETFYAVEEEYATGWLEVTFYGARLAFRSAQGAIEFIRALDCHRGGYVDEDLLREMVTS
jgi:hypothetical protein